MKLLLFVPQKSYFLEAIDFAGLLAKKTESPLHLLHLTKGPKGFTQGQNALDEISDRLSPLEPASQRVTSGDALDALRAAIL
ncbi:MAG: hypothetical protein OEV06_10070, partial [Anaerolineae bacterium]|nr:hypothetical protein [Anaerolineae bacterium]